MPIKPENRSLYPSNWKEISLRIRARRAGYCECTGQCGLEHGSYRHCERRNGEPIPGKTALTVLTVAHLNHDPADCRDENLLALCQACHLRYDAGHHAMTARATRERKSGQLLLF